MLKRLILSLMAISLIVSLSSCQVSSPFVTGAKVNMQNKDYESAKSNLEKALENNPQDAEALYLKGTIHLRQKEYDQMKQCYVKALEIDPVAHKEEIDKDINKAYRTLLSLGVNHNYNKAIEVIDKDSTSSKELMDKAETILEQASNMKENEFMVWRYLGLIAKHKEEYERAISLFNRALENQDHIKVNPQKEKSVKMKENAINMTYADIINSYSKLGDKDKKIEFIKKLIERDPENTQALFQLANHYYELEDYDKSLEVYKKILEINPDDASMKMNYGLILDKKGDTDGAIKIFKDLVQSNPDAIKTRIAFAGIYFKKEKYQELVVMLEPIYEKTSGEQKKIVANLLFTSYYRLNNDEKYKFYYNEQKKEAN